MYPPTEAQEAVRDLSRCREAAQKDLARAQQRLMKCLLRRGLAYTSGTLWTLKHLTWLRGLKFDDPVFGQVYTEYLMQVSLPKTHFGQYSANGVTSQRARNPILRVGSCTG